MSSHTADLPLARNRPFGSERLERSMRVVVSTADVTTTVRRLADDIFLLDGCKFGVSSNVAGQGAVLGLLKSPGLAAPTISSPGSVKNPDPLPPTPRGRRVRRRSAPAFRCDSMCGSRNCRIFRPPIPAQRNKSASIGGLTLSRVSAIEARRLVCASRAAAFDVATTLRDETPMRPGVPGHSLRIVAAALPAALARVVSPSPTLKSHSELTLFRRRPSRYRARRRPSVSTLPTSVRMSKHPAALRKLSL